MEETILKTTDIEVLKPQDLTNALRIRKADIRKYLDKDEINERFTKVTHARDRALMQTLWMTGLRVTEVNQIKKGDIDFANKEMIVKHLKSRRFNERLVPIRSEIRDLLQIYSAPLLHDQKIFSYSRQQIFNICKKWMGISPHQFRHSFAVNFLRQSSSAHSLVVLKNLMGHRNIQTTMEYLKLVPADWAKELEQVKFT